MPYFGNKTDGDVTISITNRVYGTPFVAPENGIARKLYINYNNDPVGIKFNLGIYDVNRNLLADSGQATAGSGAGWHSLDIPGLFIKGGETYILAQACNSGVVGIRYYSVSGTLYIPFHSYSSSLPAVLGSASVTGTIMMYCEYEPGWPYLPAKRDMPSGYHCFISQFVRNLRAGYIPLETPDGVNRCW